MSQEEAALTLDGYERSLKEARIIKRAHLLAVTEAAEKVTAPVKSELPGMLLLIFILQISSQILNVLYVLYLFLIE